MICRITRRIVCFSNGTIYEDNGLPLSCIPDTDDITLEERAPMNDKNGDHVSELYNQ
jgi:hypothetical protein